eukprot:UN34548
MASIIQQLITLAKLRESNEMKRLENNNRKQQKSLIRSQTHRVSRKVGGEQKRGNLDDLVNSIDDSDIEYSSPKAKTAPLELRKTKCP